MKIVQYFLAVILVLIAACSKKEVNGACRSGFPNKILSSGGPVYDWVLYFRSDGRLDSITGTDDVYSFAYKDNTITTIDRHSAKLYSKDVTELDSRGLIIKTSSYYYNKDETIPSAPNSVTIYEYEGTQLIKATYTTVSPAFPVFVYYYQWKDGNLESSSLVPGNHPAQVTHYTYYLDKPAAPGDDNIMKELFQYGNTASLIKNRNLVKSTDYPNSPDRSYSYSFDDKGKIIAQTTLVDGKNYTDRYQYSCYQQ